MAIVGDNFPQSRDARKAELKRILAEEKPISSVKIPGRGIKSVYKIPLTFLSYNPHNTRFLAEAKTIERRLGSELSDENYEHVEEIEKFIWNSKRDKNESTIDSLIKDGQLQPGVVTIDGIILSGNRRFRLLNEISRNKSRYSRPGINLDGLEYFEAAIIEQQLSKKDIVKYESYYQYGTDDKVDYDPIQKYIAAHDQREMGFSIKEVADNFATMTEGKERKVKEWLEVYDLMDEYLQYIGENGIFTALESQEESFLQLRSTLKSFNSGRSGNSIWAYDEFDLINFKQIYFDYIRIGKSTHEFRNFKKIFEDESRWKNFSQKVQDIVTEGGVSSFENYRDQHCDLDESSISRQRNRDYKEKVEDSLNKAFGAEYAKIINEQQQELPIDILQTIQSKIEFLEIYMEMHKNTDSYVNEAFLVAVRDIQSRIGKIKQRVD